MAGLRGNPATLQTFKKRIQRFPVVLAQSVATEAAPELTALAAGAYSGGRTVFGELRPRGEDGRELSLVKTGLTKRSVRFSAVGTVVRCVLGPRYARFLVGKYAILPNRAIPFEWGQRLNDIVGRHQP